MKKTLFVFLTFLISFAVHAQTFYEVVYYDTVDEQEYAGLMTYWDNENCTLRCVQTDNIDVFWECDYGVNFDKEDGLNYMIFYPMPPEDKQDASYPYFVWTWTKKDASDQTESPYVVFDTEEIGDDMDFAETFKEIELSSMDEEYIKQFYDEDEEMYDIILEACNLVKQQNEEQETAVSTNPSVTMHFIMVAATKDKTIGPSVKTDLNLAEPEFKRFAEQLKINYREYIVADNDFNKANVLKAIKSIKASPNDIIVFFYSGHGFRFDDDTDEYPNMSLHYKGEMTKNDYLGVSETYNMLTAKKARLTIVLSDCCNSYYGATRQEVDSSALVSRGLSNYNLTKLEKLFIKDSGTIKITAAKAGQYALCDSKGGFLLTSFLNNIHSMVSAVSTQEPSWQTITDNAREYVRRKTTGFDETGKDTDPQIVVKNVNVK